MAGYCRVTQLDRPYSRRELIVSFHLDKDTIPVIYRIVVTVDGEEVVNSTRYLMPQELEAVQGTLFVAFAQVYDSNDLVVDVFPA